MSAKRQILLICGFDAVCISDCTASNGRITCQVILWHSFEKESRRGVIRVTVLAERTEKTHDYYSEEITTSIFRAKQSKKNGPSLKMEALFCYETSLTVSQQSVTVQKT